MLGTSSRVVGQFWCISLVCLDEQTELENADYHSPCHHRHHHPSSSIIHYPPQVSIIHQRRFISQQLPTRLSGEVTREWLRASMADLDSVAANMKKRKNTQKLVQSKIIILWSWQGCQSQKKRCIFKWRLHICSVKIYAFYWTMLYVYSIKTKNTDNDKVLERGTPKSAKSNCFIWIGEPGIRWHPRFRGNKKGASNGEMHPLQFQLLFHLKQPMYTHFTRSQNHPKRDVS